MLNIHLHDLYFSINKCSNNIYYNRFHAIRTAFYTFSQKQNSPGKVYLPGLSEYFSLLKNTFAIFNKMLKMYYTKSGTILSTKPMRFSFRPSLFLSAQ